MTVGNGVFSSGWKGVKVVDARRLISAVAEGIPPDLPTIGLHAERSRMSANNGCPRRPILPPTLGLIDQSFQPQFFQGKFVEGFQIHVHAQSKVGWYIDRTIRIKCKTLLGNIFYVIPV